MYLLSVYLGEGVEMMNSATLRHLRVNITDGCPVHIHVGRPRETPQQRVENEQQHASEFLDLSR